MNSEDIVVILICATGFYLIFHTGLWLFRLFAEILSLVL